MPVNILLKMERRRLTSLKSYWTLSIPTLCALTATGRTLFFRLATFPQKAETFATFLDLMIKDVSAIHSAYGWIVGFL